MDVVFAEFYTSLMPGLSIQKLEELVGREVLVVSRRSLEEEEGREILQEAKTGKTALLVPGDPLISTTHVDLRIRAEKEGIKTKVIHGASIISVVMGLSGLQNYKYGRSVTIPFPEEGFVSETPYEVIRENRRMRLHTLCFLDIRVEEERYMTITEVCRCSWLWKEESDKSTPKLLSRIHPCVVFPKIYGYQSEVTNVDVAITMNVPCRIP